MTEALAAPAAAAPRASTEWPPTDLINETIAWLQVEPTALRIAFWATGGNARPKELVAFLAGEGALPDGEYNRLAAALNDRLIEAGAPPCIPYTEDHR